jgi:hypothetical protein
MAEGVGFQTHLLANCYKYILSLTFMLATHLTSHQGTSTIDTWSYMP